MSSISSDSSICKENHKHALISLFSCHLILVFNSSCYSLCWQLQSLMVDIISLFLGNSSNRESASIINASLNSSLSVKDKEIFLFSKNICNLIRRSGCILCFLSKFFKRRNIAVRTIVVLSTLEFFVSIFQYQGDSFEWRVLRGYFEIVFQYCTF